MPEVLCTCNGHHDAVQSWANWLKPCCTMVCMLHGLKDMIGYGTFLLPCPVRTAAQLSGFYLCTGLKPADLESPNPVSALQFLINPSAQIQELRQALTALSGQTANSQVSPFLLIPQVFCANQLWLRNGVHWTWDARLKQTVSVVMSAWRQITAKLTDGIKMM